MPTDRDPCENPRPGDVIEKDGRRRTVTDRVSNTIHYDNGQRACLCWITSWWEWARKATVIKRGSRPA